MKILLPTLNRVLCAGALVLAFLPVTAQGRPEFCRGGGPRGGAFATIPGLTEAQKASMAVLESKNRPALEQKRLAAEEAREALRQAMAKSSTDRVALKGLFDKESQARFAMLEAHQAFRQEMDKILTPEQKAQMESRRSGGPGMRGEMGMGRGMGRGEGMGMGRGRGEGMGRREGMGMGRGQCMGIGQGEGSCPRDQR